MKTEEKTIGDSKFTTTQLPAVRGFKLFGRLVKQVGPLFGAFAQLDGQGASLQQALPQLASALHTMDPDELLSLAREVLASTMVHVPDSTGGRVLPLDRDENINLVFTGRLRTMIEVLLFVIGVNFSDFLQGGLAPVAALKTTTPSAA